MLNQKQNGPMRLKKTHFYSIFLSIILLTFLPFSPLIIFNPTSSAPKGFYLIRSSQLPGKNDYVITKNIEGVENVRTPDSMLKKIAGYVGDLYCSTADSLIIAGNKYERIEGFDFEDISGVLKEDEYLLINDVYNSYDSRYYGIVGKENITKVVSFFTWE